MSSYLVFLNSQLRVTPPAAPAGTSLVGKVGIVTGSNVGLGYYASRQLLELGLSHLIMAVRDPAKGEAAKTTLLDSLPVTGGKKPIIDVWKMDLGDYNSVIAFVEKLKTSGVKPNFAILNAGVAKLDFELNKQTSNEVTIQTNWLSTMLLTMLLMPVMKQTGTQEAPSTISIVGSEVAAWAQFKEAKAAEKSNSSVLATLNDSTYFVNTDRYNTSKLLLLLSVRELVARRSPNDNVILNLVNPGLCSGSSLHRDATGLIGAILSLFKRLIGRTSDIGARTLVHGGAWAGEETDGKYLSDCKPATEAAYVNTKAGIAMQDKLWKELTVELGKVVDMSSVLASI